MFTLIGRDKQFGHIKTFLLFLAHQIKNILLVQKGKGDRSPNDLITRILIASHEKNRVFPGTNFNKLTLELLGFKTLIPRRFCKTSLVELYHAIHVRG